LRSYRQVFFQIAPKLDAVCSFRREAHILIISVQAAIVSIAEHLPGGEVGEAIDS